GIATYQAVKWTIIAITALVAAKKAKDVLDKNPDWSLPSPTKAIKKLKETAKAFVDGVIDIVHQMAKKKKKAKSSGKERATNAPSWVNGRKPAEGQSVKKWVKDLMDDRYGEGNYKKGADTEYNKIKKYAERYNK
ncbi:MAG: hypothetical protein GY765_23415, partial [bacterium]|nr:hypothetical protein [bacterium]